MLKSLGDQSLPIGSLLGSFLSLKYQRVRARFDSEVKRSVFGESTCTSEEVMQPKYPIGATMFLQSFLPRILTKVSAPLLEPIRSTYAFEIIKESLEEKLLLTEQAQMKHLATKMMKKNFENSGAQSKHSGFIYDQTSSPSSLKPEVFKPTFSFEQSQSSKLIT